MCGATFQRRHDFHRHLAIRHGQRPDGSAMTEDEIRAVRNRREGNRHARNEVKCQARREVQPAKKRGRPPSVSRAARGATSCTAQALSACAENAPATIVEAPVATADDSATGELRSQHPGDSGDVPSSSSIRRVFEDLASSMPNFMDDPIDDHLDPTLLLVPGVNEPAILPPESSPANEQFFATLDENYCRVIFSEQQREAQAGRRIPSPQRILRRDLSSPVCRRRPPPVPLRDIWSVVRTMPVSAPEDVARRVVRSASSSVDVAEVRRFVSCMLWTRYMTLDLIRHVVPARGSSSEAESAALESIRQVLDVEGRCPQFSIGDTDCLPESRQDRR